MAEIAGYTMPCQYAGRIINTSQKHFILLSFRKIPYGIVYAKHPSKTVEAFISKISNIFEQQAEN